MNVSCAKVLTFQSLKLSATDVAISLPGIVATFSLPMTFNFVGNQELNLIMYSLWMTEVMKMTGNLLC